MRDHYTVRELRSSERKAGLALLVAMGFHSAVDDGVTEAEVLLGAFDSMQRLVGVLRARTLRRGASDSEVGLLGVLKERRRHGIGRALLDEFCQQEFTAGARQVDVQVAPGAVDSLRSFYEACGFHRAGPYYRRMRRASSLN